MFNGHVITLCLYAHNACIRKCFHDHKNFPSLMGDNQYICLGTIYYYYRVIWHALNTICSGLGATLKCEQRAITNKQIIIIATLFIIGTMTAGEVNQRIRQGHNTTVIIYKPGSLKNGTKNQCVSVRNHSIHWYYELHTLTKVIRVGTQPSRVFLVQGLMQT